VREPLQLRGTATVVEIPAGVLGSSARPDVERLVRLGDAAVEAVDAVWGAGWRRPVTLVAVAGSRALAQGLGRPEPAVAGLVAVADHDRVWVDVPALQGLTSDGQAVLVTHEVTHLATGAADSAAVPLWLEEGFADVVGLTLRGAPSVDVTAAALLADVRAGDPPPPELPSEADFAAGGARADRAYAGALLAVDLLHRRLGLAGVVALYRATSAGPGPADTNVERALRAAGLSTDVLTGAWRADLAARAARGP